MQKTILLQGRPAPGKRAAGCVWSGLDASLFRRYAPYEDVGPYGCGGTYRTKTTVGAFCSPRPHPCRGAHCAPAVEDGNKRFAPRERAVRLLRCRLRRRGLDASLFRRHAPYKTVPYKVGGTYRTK
ncbi:MAG: hypothetical protein IJW62_07885 [Clostridia bacterium]|nr:hypothetical protein [Clostridia bacterium]